jgi:hypothetical protein
MVGRLEEAAEILDAALALVKSDGKITLHVANLTPHPPESWTGVLARRFIESRANLRIASTGSWPGSRAIAALTWGLEDWSKKGMFRMLKLVVSLAVSIPLAALAYVLERKAGNAGRIGRHCTSITLEIDLGAASAEHPARVVDSRPASVLV